MVQIVLDKNLTYELSVTPEHKKLHRAILMIIFGAVMIVMGLWITFNVNEPFDFGTLIDFLGWVFFIFGVTDFFVLERVYG